MWFDILGFGVTSALLIAASIQDWKTMYVCGELVFSCWILCLSLLYFNSNSTVYHWIFVCVLAIVCYLPFDIPGFGDADLLPIAFYFAYYAPTLSATTVALFGFPVFLLLCLIPYGKIWGRAHGMNWSFGDAVPMPMLPCFTAAWVLSGTAFLLVQLLQLLYFI